MSDGPGGILARQMLVPALLVPLILGYLHLAAEERGLLDRGLASGLFAVSLVVAFAAAVRRPLNVILGWAHMLRVGRAAGDEGADAADIVARNGKMLARLVDDLAAAGSSRWRRRDPRARERAGSRGNAHVRHLIFSPIDSKMTSS